MKEFKTVYLLLNGDGKGCEQEHFLIEQYVNNKCAEGFKIVSDSIIEIAKENQINNAKKIQAVILARETNFTSEVSVS